MTSAQFITLGAALLTASMSAVPAQIVTTPDDSKPAPIVWLDSLERGFEAARTTGRPLFVTLRCLPCKQCADFDRDVLEGGPALDPLLRRFVTVRLTDAAAIDLQVMPVDGFQDLDLSWWGWFLTPQGSVLGVFGGRDEVSDSTRISVAALRNTLTRVLEHERTARPPLPQNDAPRSVRDLPGFASWRARTPIDAESKAANCIHCHQVAEILRQPALDAGTFDKQRDFEVWPLPENVGITVDRDDGLRVTQVTVASPAAAAGIDVGDRLVTAGGRRLFGQADLRGALHRADRDRATIELTWQREGSEHRGTLHTAPGWKVTLLDWRMSVSQGNAGAGPGFWPLTARSGDRARYGVRDGVMLIRPWWDPNQNTPAQRGGLLASDAILAVDGQSPDLAGRGFLVWFRMRKEPGEEVRLRVHDGKREREVAYRLPTRGD